MEFSEMGLIGTIIFLLRYIIPVAIPLAILYRLGVRITSDFAVFAFVLSFVLGILVDVILPLHFNISLKYPLVVLGESISNLPGSGGIMEVLTILFYALINSAVLVPLGILLRYRE